MVVEEKFDFKGMISCLRDLFIYFHELRNRTPVANYIQNPRIPSIFSENLVLFLLNSKIIQLDEEFTNFYLGGRIADIVGETSAGSRLIEVKASGSQNFQYFGEKDINADYIVWIDFGNFFEDAKLQTADFYIFRPKIDNLVTQKIDLIRLRRRLIKQELKVETLDLEKYGIL